MKNDRGMEQELFVCDCGDVSHQFIVSWYPDDEDWNDLLYVQIHLNQSYSFWKRLWHGIKYVFGHKCRFGSFDEILINSYDAKRLRKILDDFIEKNKGADIAEKQKSTLQV